MPMQMYNSRLFSTLAFRLKFPARVQNYSRKVGGPDLNSDHEKPYYVPERKGPPPATSWSVNVLALCHRTTLTWAEVKAKYKWKQEQDMRDDQRFIPERQKILGADLAVAHFITWRGGKVKFKHRNDWITKENILSGDIPSSFVPEMHIEAIDASDTNLCYEGFENLTLLLHLKELILRNCPYIDDWCLHRLYMFEGCLEYLDISGCQNVTERGICTLYNLKHLKRLTLENTPNIASKELACLLLQDVLPKCDIVGVDYTNPSLWERLKEYLT